MTNITSKIQGMIAESLIAAICTVTDDVIIGDESIFGHDSWAIGEVGIMPINGNLTDYGVIQVIYRYGVGASIYGAIYNSEDKVVYCTISSYSSAKLLNVSVVLADKLIKTYKHANHD